MWTPRIFQYVQEQHSVHVFIYMCTRFLLTFVCLDVYVAIVLAAVSCIV